MVRTNRDRLVQISVGGTIAAPRATAGVFRVDREGRAYSLPGAGGICFNVRVGDPAFGWAGDNVHPGVAVMNEKAGINDGLNLLACLGNRAVVTSGDAIGAQGVVVGKHGFVDALGLLDVMYLIVDFGLEILERLSIGDHVQIRACGRGLELEGYADVHVKNCDPELLERLEIGESEQGVLQVPVAAAVPVRMMGEGTDENSERGAQSIMSSNQNLVEELGLQNLRLGDLVALLDQDHRYGRAYQPGAISIGVVVHGDSPMAGHGPGVTTLLTCTTGCLKPVRDPGANLGRYLQLA